MEKHRVIYEVKNKRKQIVEKSKTFSEFHSACNFIREIKSVSMSKPILESR